MRQPFNMMADAEVMAGILGISLDRAAWLVLMIREQIDETYRPEDWVNLQGYGPIRRESAELIGFVMQQETNPKTAEQN